MAAFYAAVLGEPAPEPGGDVYRFDAEGVQLLIHRKVERSAEPGHPRDVDHIAIEVGDLDGECERLRAAGYDVVGPSRFPWGRSAYLHDPDGRMVELQEP